MWSCLIKKTFPLSSLARAYSSIRSMGREKTRLSGEMKEDDSKSHMFFHMLCTHWGEPALDLKAFYLPLLPGGLEELRLSRCWPYYQRIFFAMHISLLVLLIKTQ